MNLRIIHADLEANFSREKYKPLRPDIFKQTKYILCTSGN